VVEALLVANDLDRNKLACGMIAASEHLAKRAFSEGTNYLITEREVIVIDNQIITTVIVIAIVVCRVVRSRWLLVTALAIEVYFLVVKDFLSLVLG
jgi:hypothetical protein